MIQLPASAFSVFELILLALLSYAWIYQLYFYMRYLTAVRRCLKAEHKGRLRFAETKPPVSVIVCARDATDLLKQNLPSVLSQNYPEYEVIVVNDGNNELTDILLRELKHSYPQLRSTFVPHGTTNISTKKLALTLGIKAARYDWLLFTDADCAPGSDNWIASMMRNATQGTEIILGYGAYQNQKGMLNRLITYDTLFIALQYLGFAHAGKPYMGVGRNLAYHKSVFQRNNGFTPNLNLPSGDDDLFVNRAATKFNTRIEVSPGSVTWSEPKQSLHAWLYQKERHLSVSSYYTTRSKFALLGEPFSRGLFYSSWLTACVVFGISRSWIVLAAVVLLFLLRFMLQMTVINKSSAVYSSRRFTFDILIFDIYLPLVSAAHLLFGRMGKKARYMPWQ
jgi:cellulose synthase/poly-beta-1,6-N-acetylglucosamine synthase-like glycosyltransferase